jgi:hypothetical protein
MTSPSGGELRIPALLSVQRALWGRVTPDLRGVAVSWPEGGIIVRCVYEGGVDEDTRELVSEAETETMADFDPEVEVRYEIEVVGPERSIPRADGEWWAYRRFEG